MKDIDWAAFMQDQAEVDRLAQAKMPGVPSPNFIANFVGLQRAITGWTQDALAFLADVSLTTIQRIQRAEAVSPEYRVALALGKNLVHLPSLECRSPPISLKVRGRNN